MCDLVFIVVHDEEKSDVSISWLYLDGTGSCCLANTIVACEILPVRKKEPPLDGEGELCLRRGEEPRSALYILSHLYPQCYFQRGAARPNKSGIATHVKTSDRELRVCAPRDDTAQTAEEPAGPPPTGQGR